MARALDTLWQLLLEVPVAVFTTLLSARLLGARRSWVATAQAGVLGWVGGNLIQCGAAGWTWDAARLSVATVSVSTVLTMLAAVTMDFLARPGSLARAERAGLLVPPHPLRDMRRLLAPYARYRQLVGIARANGLALPIGRRAAAARRTTSFGESLRATLEQGGAVFVKLGQMASTRDDLLPASLRAELSHLQGAVEPLPREPMQAHLEAEMGGPVEEFFAEFDWQPIGSASIAQAYLARLATGEPVVVKIQRPGIEALVERDTAALLHLAGLVERRTPQGRDLRVAEMAEEFTHSLRQELDFPLEAANAIDLAAVTAPDAGVRIPHVYVEVSTQRVLIQERLHGRSVAETARIAELGLDPRELADRLVRAMVDHMFASGHFHADPHPGNVFLLDDGNLGLIDFGSTGRLTPSQRAALFQMTLAASSGDAAALRDSIEQVTVVGTESGDLALERALSRFLSENVGPGRSMTGAFNNLTPLLARFDIRLPSDLTLFFRSLVLLDGTARTICPGYSLVDAMQRLLGETISTGGGATARDQLVDELLQQLPRLRRLPAQVDRIATLAARGDLRARIALFSTEADARVVTTLVNRFVLAGIGGLIAVASAILLTATETGDAGTIQLTRVFGYVGLAVATVLLLRVVAGIVRDGYN